MSVALRKESVDRNLREGNKQLEFAASLSARRAWIEMLVDVDFAEYRRSLSARRAWIEIRPTHTANRACQVALRKESVDRNPCVGCADGMRFSRSPQGERG